MEVVLNIREPSGSWRHLTLGPSPVVVGRAPDSGLPLADPKVSRQHLQLAIEAGLPVVVDLGSTNGTFVNGRRVSRQVLQPGDRVVAGDTEITVVSAGATASPAAAIPAAMMSMRPPPPPPPAVPWARPDAPPPGDGGPLGPSLGSPHMAAPPAPAPPGPSQVELRGSERPLVVVQGDKSFVGPAFLCWLLYYLGCFLIGLVMNLSYLSEANGFRQTTGRPASGTGCLWALLIVHVFLPIAAVIVVGLLLAAGVTTLPAILHR